MRGLIESSPNPVAGGSNSSFGGPLDRASARAKRPTVLRSSHSFGEGERSHTHTHTHLESQKMGTHIHTVYMIIYIYVYIYSMQLYNSFI